MGVDYFGGHFIAQLHIQRNNTNQQFRYGRTENGYPNPPRKHEAYHSLNGHISGDVTDGGDLHQRNLDTVQIGTPNRQVFPATKHTAASKYNKYF